MFDVIVSVEFWKFAAPLFGAVVAWFFNEWRRRVWEQYQKEEANYRELLLCLKGFYTGANSTNELKGEFLNQLNLCWLYCPDEVILKGYGFLNTVRVGSSSTDEEREKAVGDLVASIRDDLLSRKLVKRTNLSGKDFKHLSVN